MPLEVIPVEEGDFGKMSTYLYRQGGDLIAPMVPLFWPDSDDEASNAERTRWSMEMQREIFNCDPTVKFLKVVDTDKNEIISLARWHFYENGYQHPQFTPLELNGAQPDANEKWPKQANKALATAIVEQLFGARKSWMGTEPQWVLCTLMTKEPERRRGAGGMLIQWGVDQARKQNVPAHLEAVAAASPLYEKFGFRVVGKQDLQLQEFGFPVVTLARMAANKH